MEERFVGRKARDSGDDLILGRRYDEFENTQRRHDGLLMSPAHFLETTISI